ncbi:hypothetical protein FDP41_012495 [Naegleria fowleri]|uniref:Uncharacterized protein n=1 Tax=Naegleria fowleri TaxID=5763 RepID=A0A6A5C7B0_NAEFO|nr:uncharacterized protein FDP41_012495 [Naegleria fowleri]KAF0981385.1 hypothetical protein FDP41_012495 [Naegleria fowleri]
MVLPSRRMPLRHFQTILIIIINVLELWILMMSSEAAMIPTVPSQVSFDTGSNNTNSAVHSSFFQFNNRIPSSSLIPIFFNITKETVNDNMKIYGGCLGLPCNFMIINATDYFDFLQNPSLGLLRKNAAQLGLLNITNVDGTLLFIGDAGLYAFIAVNPNVNSTWLSVKAELKFSYGRHVVLLFRQYWYLVLVLCLVVVLFGLLCAFAVNKIKGREMLNGMTRYSKKQSQLKRALLTEEDIVVESFIEHSNNGDSQQ